jgi:hypothetical protein
VTDEDRQQRALASLSRLTASPSSSGVWTPAWSSQVLEKTIASILSAENAKVGDVLRALWQLAGRNDVTLTAQWLISSVTSSFFASLRYRTLYDSDDLAWMAEGIRGQANSIAGISGASRTSRRIWRRYRGMEYSIACEGRNIWRKRRPCWRDGLLTYVCCTANKRRMRGYGRLYRT